MGEGEDPDELEEIGININRNTLFWGVILKGSGVAKIIWFVIFFK